MQKILIVDDHPAMRKIIRQVIEQESGWQVCREAANGAEGRFGSGEAETEQCRT